jgi:type III secretion protein J
MTTGPSDKGPPCARALGLLALLALAACTSPVAAGLDEPDANRIVVALDHATIDSTKEIDPGTEGKFRVIVARDDAARALIAMRDEELPRTRPAGVLDAMGKGSLVPSQAAEHAQFVAGVAGDLERTLESIDGVLSARVHLNLPAPDPLREAPPSKASASVLFSYRGSTPPLATESVQRLVAGGVGGLVPADVAVVALSRPSPANGAGTQLAHVGPLAVARGSMRPLQLALAGLILVAALFATMTIVFYSKLTRLRAESESREK